MKAVVEYINDKPMVRRVETLCGMLGGDMPNSDVSITTLFKFFDKHIKDRHPKVSGGALNNCHGDWFEWLIAMCAWNYSLKNNSSHILLPLPNIAQFDVTSLYEAKLYRHIKDLRSKIIKATGTELISSNPDFVIVDRGILERLNPEHKQIEIITPSTISMIEDAYKHYVATCCFDSIVGYLSVKTSLRPDRRLQICHEGSLIKSLYAHLKTREWMLDAKGVKYYAASTTIKDADKKALRTVATHSLVSVNGLPEPAVDQVFAVDSISEITQMLDCIIGR